MTEILSAVQATDQDRLNKLGTTPEEREAYRARDREIRLAHRRWLEQENGTFKLSDDARNAMYRKAWNDGHDNGYNSVEDHYDEIASIVRLAIGHN